MPRKQVLEFGKIHLERLDEDDVLYFLAGKKLYVVGAQSGKYPPFGWRRPGFLVGKRIDEVGPEERPERAAHLLNEMSGIWSQPIKVLDRIEFRIREEGSAETWALLDSHTFVNHFSHAEFLFERDGLSVRRLDFVAEDEPALFATLTVANRRAERANLTLTLSARVNLMPAWFAGWPHADAEVSFTDTMVTARDTHDRWRDRWAVVLGSSREPVEPPRDESVDGKRNVHLSYRLGLGPGLQEEMPFLFVAANSGGAAAAQRTFRKLAGQQAQLLRQKERHYHRKVFGGVTFDCSDNDTVAAYYCAKANLQLLVADLPPPLGRFFLAGIPEYVQLFGTDTAYAVPGAVAAGYARTAREALRLLGAYANRQCGRVPHEVTANGRVFHPGNPQETPQFAIACWNYFRWTGDRPFLEEVYPLCEEGLLDYVVAQWDADLDFYPNGQSMVERRGADDENVDAVCYFCRALQCLADMADALGYEQDARRYRDQLAGVLRVSMNQDFWLDEKSLYADSLGADHRARLEGFWTVIVPLETDLAEPDKAARTLRTLQQEEGWLGKFGPNGDKYGLVHTLKKEPTVWTLPTGILARAALVRGEIELGMRLLDGIALTTRSDTKHGMLGAFEELIPEGLSFIQLWSPAVFIQGLVEGVFGLNPMAHLDQLEIFVQPRATWTRAKLERIRVGDRQLSIVWERVGGERLRITQHNGRRLSYRLFLAPTPCLDYLEVTGASVTVTIDPKSKRGVLTFQLEPGERLLVTVPASVVPR